MAYTKYLLVFLAVTFAFACPAALPAHRAIFGQAICSDSTADYPSAPLMRQHKSFFQRRYDRRGHPGAIPLMAFLCSLLAFPAGFILGGVGAFIFGLTSYVSILRIITLIYAGCGIIGGIFSLTRPEIRGKNRGFAIAAIVLGAIFAVIALSL